MRYLITILCVLSLVSCRVKQKTVEREKIEEKKEQTVSTLETEETEKTADSSVVTKTVTIVRQEDEFVDLEGDGSGTITRETEKTDKGIKETFTGVSNVIIGKNKTEAVKVDSTNIVKTESVKTNNVQKKDSTSISEVKSSSRKTDSDVKGMNTWFVIGAILVLIVLVILWYINRKAKIL